MDNLIWVPDAAKKLNVTPSCIYHWDKVGKVTLVKKSYRDRYITQEDFDKMMELSLPEGMKKCKYCNFVGSVENFAKSRSRCIDCHKKYEQDRWARNAEKHAKYHKEKYDNGGSELDKKRAGEWYHRNKDRVKALQLERMYGISQKEYEDMKIRCNNKCEICGSDTAKLCVDHNHTTGNVRGLLCAACNSGIGHLKDDTNLLVAAVDYLEKYEK